MFDYFSHYLLGVICYVPALIPPLLSVLLCPLINCFGSTANDCTSHLPPPAPVEGLVTVEQNMFPWHQQLLESCCWHSLHWSPLSAPGGWALIGENWIWHPSLWCHVTTVADCNSSLLSALFIIIYCWLIPLSFPVGYLLCIVSWSHLGWCSVIWPLVDILWSTRCHFKTVIHAQASSIYW